MGIPHDSLMGTSKNEVFRGGVWGEAPHIALLLFAEKQKGRVLEMPFIYYIPYGYIIGHV